jgi:hypothetical protein
LVWREGRNKPFLVLNVFGCDGVYGREPGVGERDERAAPVGGVGIAADETAGFEPVETLRRAAAWKGQTNGEELEVFGAEWYAVSAAGAKVEKSDTTTSSSGGDPTPGGGYGY